MFLRSSDVCFFVNDNVNNNNYNNNNVNSDVGVRVAEL